MPSILISAGLCPVGAKRRHSQKGDARTLFNDFGSTQISLPEQIGLEFERQV